MEFICKRNKLSEAISNVQRAVSSKSCLTALEGILIKTDEDKITLCGYDLELGIKTTVPASIEEKGEIVIGAKILSEIIRKLPDEEVSIKVTENCMATINSGKSEFSIMGTPHTDYPELPSVADTEVISIKNSVLKSMIKQTIFAISTNDSKPIHTGTFFSLEQSVLRLISVDGYRLALRKEKIDFSSELSFVVPGKALSEILKLLPDNDEKSSIFIGNKHIVFKIEEYFIISRLLEGDFLDYHSTIPKEQKTEVIFNTRECINNVERVSLMVTDRLRSPVRCVISDNKAKFLCTTTIGKAVDECAISKTGESLEIGFNHKYLLDALKNVEDDEVKFLLNGQLSPIKIVPKDGDSFIFLVLPVRLKAED